MNSDYSIYLDEKLWGMFVIGDKHAFTALYDRYKKPIHAFFYNRLYQNPEIAKDATQSLFLKLIEKQSNYNEQYKFKTWIFTIANNQCKNIYRQKEMRSRELPERNQVTEVNSEYDIIQFRTEFHKALGLLNQEQAEIVLLRYQSDLSIKEIALCLDIAEGTVKSRLFYSIKKLSKELSSLNYQDFKKISLWKN